jgi:hypothetical protein
MSIIFYIIAFLISLLLGTITLWLVSKLSPKPLNFKYAVFGAFLTEIPKYLSLLVKFPKEIVDISRFLIAWIVLIKLASTKPFNGFLGAILYSFVRVILAVIFITAFTILGVKLLFA